MLENDVSTCVILVSIKNIYKISQIVYRITNHADTISISYPIYWKISVNRYTINSINKYIIYWKISVNKYTINSINKYIVNFSLPECSYAPINRTSPSLYSSSIYLSSISHNIYSHNIYSISHTIYFSFTIIFYFILLRYKFLILFIIYIFIVEFYDKI